MGRGGGPPRGSSFNTRNRVVLWGRVGGHVLVPGAEVWRRGAAGEPEAGPAPVCPCCALRCACVCVCVRLSPSSLCGQAVSPWPPAASRLVLAGEAGGEQGPASPWDVVMVTL